MMPFMHGGLMRWMWMLHLAVLVGWCVISSCSGPTLRSDPDPTAVLEAWMHALEADQPRDAWACLAPSAREGLSEEAFVELYAHRRDALVLRARQLVAWARSHPAAEQAEVVVGGQRIELVRTRAGWRISRQLSDGE